MSKKKDSKKVSVIWDGMTRKQHRNIAKYLRRMSATMGLQAWKIYLSDEHTAEDGNEEALATVTILPGRHHATIRVAKDFMTFPIEDKRCALIHELLHCHQQRLLLWADDTLKEVLGLAAYEIFNAAYRDNFEHMVDDLAVVIGRLVDDRSSLHLLKGN